MERRPFPGARFSIGWPRNADDIAVHVHAYSKPHTTLFAAVGEDIAPALNDVHAPKAAVPDNRAALAAADAIIIIVINAATATKIDADRWATRSWRDKARINRTIDRAYILAGLLPAGKRPMRRSWDQRQGEG